MGICHHFFKTFGNSDLDLFRKSIPPPTVSVYITLAFSGVAIVVAVILPL